MTTFQVTPNLRPTADKLTSIDFAAAIRRMSKVSVEASGANLGNLIDYPQYRMNGFVQTIHTSFDLHLPLVLSPDDVWVAIGQGFAQHVNNNAEKLRKMFVAHEGQKYIEIRRDNFVKGSPENDWMGGFAEFSDKIAEHVGKKRDLLVSSFSTTGPIEKATSEVILMDTLKAYFEYGCSTCCGIPSITLLGTVEDWVSIRNRAQALSEFDCKVWIDALIPVLDQFVRAAQGNADQAFWQSFYKIGGGSGGPYVTGAINVFFPYIGQQGQYVNNHLTCWERGVGHMCGGPQTDAFPPSLCSVPFTWHYYGNDLPMQFLGGFVGTSQNPDTLEVRPALGWGVADRNDSR